MKNKSIITDTDFENILGNSLRSQGLLFPGNNDQIEFFEKNIELCNIPDKLKSPDFVFEGKYRKFKRKEFVPENDEYEVNWSIAARDGKELSEEIKKKMRKDREESRRKNDKNK